VQDDLGIQVIRSSSNFSSFVICLGIRVCFDNFAGNWNRVHARENSW